MRDGIPAALGRSIEATRALFGAAACSVALVDAEGEQLEYVAADGQGAREIVGVYMPVGRGIAGWAAMSGQTIAVSDVRSDARFARDVAEATSYVPESILAAPLTSAGGEVLGVVSVLDPTTDEASDWTLDVLGTLATHMAMLVEAVDGGGPTDGPTDLARLGQEVLRTVEAWAADGERRE